MIKILHFLTDTNIGGAGKLLCNQIKNMDTSKFKIYVALPYKSALICELKSLPCTLIECEFSSDVSLSLSSIIENYEIIKQIKPDIVHSHASLSSRIAATILNVPSRIFTRHCTFPIPKEMKNPIAKMLIGSANNILSTRTIAVADIVKNDLISMGCTPKNITTIINGVEPIKHLSNDEKNYIKARLGINEKDFVITILARLKEYKGHETLLRAAKICIKNHPNFKFLIVGSGDHKNNLIFLSKELNMDENVLFLGFCGDVTHILNITDINVNCSYGTETSSLALSEGMSLGIPSVASDYGGNSHMVKNGENGLLFPAKNHEALAENLIRLYSDHALYKQCSNGAYRRFCEEFNAKLMSEKMMSLYKSEYRKHQKTGQIRIKI